MIFIENGYGIMSPAHNRGAGSTKQTVKAARIIVGLTAIVLIASAVVLPVKATNYGGGSVQSYSAETPLDVGTIVQLTGSNSNTVKIATQAQLANMFGVTIDKNQLLLAPSDDGLKNPVVVAASGTYNVLVSTQAGPIAAGDYLTLSSIDGVAMKAGIEESTVFGRANQAFDGKGITLGTTQIKDTAGNVTSTVQLGSIPVTIDVKHNPNDKSTKANLPDFLEKVGKTIADKEVSPIRIYLSLAIMAVSIITTIAMLYAGIRNGLVSIGRNPMSKKSIFRALLQVILTSLLILIIGLFAVYLLLKL